jgi:DNA polymerase
MTSPSLHPLANDALRQWIDDLGINEMINEYPQSRYKKPHNILTETVFPAVPFAPTDTQALSLHLNDIKTLDQLIHAIQTFDGCDLKKSATTCVIADGHPAADLMIIGEAPGADEDRAGKPFVGQSGQFLDHALAAIGRDRSNVYITNLIPYRPPGNRPPTAPEIQRWLPFLIHHIHLINPKIILALGGIASKALLNSTKGILSLRGQSYPYIGVEGKSTLLFPSLHPAYILRSPSSKALLWNDLLRLNQALYP